MAYIWNITKSISKQFTGNSDFNTINSKEETNFNTLSVQDKERITNPKVVSFGPVEIINVESYKKYNGLEELSLEDKEIGCMKKCSIYCKCDIY